MEKLMNYSIYFFSFLFFMVYFVFQPIMQYEAFLGHIPDLLTLCLVSTFFIFIIIVIKRVLHFKEIKISLFDSIVTLFFLNMLMQILLDYFIFSQASVLYNRNIIILLYAVMFFLVGKFFYNIEKYYKYFFIAFCILVLEKLIHFDPSTFHIETEHLTGNHKSIQTSLYLYLGDTFAVLSILVLSFINNKKLKFFIIFLSIFTLFIIYSRTALYIYVFIIMIFMNKEFSRKSKFLILAFVLVVSFGLLNYIGINNLEQMRMLSFLLTGEDSSVSGRILQFSDGIVALNDHFLEGDYGGQYHKYGFGSYMHNILSFFRQFGSIALILMLFLFYYVGKFYINFSRNYFKENINYIFYITLFIFLEAFIAKSYVSPLIWFAFGMISNTKMLNIYLRKDSKV